MEGQSNPQKKKKKKRERKRKHISDKSIDAARQST